MKKFYLLMILSVLYTSFGQAQEASDTSAVGLPVVMIKENRLEIPFNQVSRNVSVITQQEILRTPARSLSEVLSFTPGVDIRQRGVAGTQADISIRGGSFDQTLILVNGIRLTDPQTGHHMMNIPVPLQSISQIEVLKGPGARIYGQNAYAGAVNIITDISRQKSITGQIYGGDFGLRGASAAISLPAGDTFGQTISVSHDQSDGHWYNSDFKVTNLFYEAAWNTYAGDFRAMGAYSARAFGANGFYTSAFPDQYEELGTSLVALTHTLDNGTFFSNTRFYWRGNNDRYLLRRDDPAFYENIHRTNIYALEWNSRIETFLGTTGVGIEGRRENIVSNNLGDNFRDIVGSFLEHRINPTEKIDIRAGLYATYISDYDWKAFPGFEAGYQVSKALRLYTNMGTSFRVPTYTDLYYIGPTNIGNPDLEPEKAFSYEFGGKLNKKNLQFEAVYFNRSTDNLIEWTRPEGTTTWQPQNFNKVLIQGLELSARAAFNFKLAGIKVEEASLSYNFNDADLQESAGFESRYAFTALRHQFIGGVLLGFGDKVGLSIKGRRIDRETLPTYHLLDARADFNRNGAFGFFLEASNITNEEYIEAGTVEMPSRWFRAGVTFNIY